MKGKHGERQLCCRTHCDGEGCPAELPTCTAKHRGPALVAVAGSVIVCFVAQFIGRNCFRPDSETQASPGAQSKA